MVASACLTLSLMHLTTWFRNTDQRAHLLMSIGAISAAAIAAFELLLMRAQTTQQFGTLLQWAHLPVFLVVVSIVGFVQLYFRAGRPWLAWTVCGLRLSALVINSLSVPNLNYKEIGGLLHLPIWGGETISVAKGVPNPWVTLSHLSFLLLLIFVVDASVTLWGRGGRTERRRALVVGGSITFCILVSAVHSALLNFGLIRSPYIISFAFLAIVAAMGYELGSDMSRAEQLVRQLQASEAALRESEQQMALVADAAELAMWMWDIPRDEVWTTEKGRTFFGFAQSEKIDLNRFLHALYPGGPREGPSESGAGAEWHRRV
jgi:hypothetical protein